MTDIDFRWFWWVSEFWNMIILTREGISTTALSICKMSVHHCDHRMVLYPAFLFLRIHCKEAYFSIFFLKFEAWECKRFIVIREIRIGLLLQSLCLVPVFSRNTEGSLWHCVLQKPVILQVPVQKKFIAFVVITKPFH